ncbi:MAG: helix-turn-helix domain-containing protein [Ectothiorhodospiraceae bacterium]|nr:helix-turn-helix domain-containing protein [Ectothiorhodospiraceae bacterium]MCH8504729.1 helix-turn-helix domain-containing protein [Ectothiorhodospiraceae bacterium]
MTKLAELLEQARTAKSLTTPQAAAYLSLSPNTLTRWRWSGDGPRFCKYGRAVRYNRDDLDQWIRESSRGSTSEVA